MTREEQEPFRPRLDEIAEGLRADLALADPTAESITPDSAIGRITRMEAIQAQSMGEEGRRRQEARLRQVERALDRLEQGTYGLCVRCGTEIPRGRLEIMPEAPFCITCAARQR